MTGEASIDNSQIEAFQSNFVLMTAQDLKRLMMHKNQVLESKKILEQAKSSVMAERDDLRSKLGVELAKDDINVDEITAKMVAEKMDEANAKFNEERDTLNGFLQSKIN